LPRGIGAGEKQLSRNTQTIIDVVLYSTYFWDGRANSLEEQTLGPIESPDEMNQDLNDLVEELNEVKGYVAQFESVYGTAVTKEGIAKSLAAFQRTIVSRNSPLDRYLAGDKKAMSRQAVDGMKLFLGRADCVRCHNGPLLSDGKYYRLGVDFIDKGRGAVTGRRDDMFKFRTPSLRNIAETAPYMHDGSEASLFDVVEFYFRRAPTRGPDGLTVDVDPLIGESYSDIDAVVEFLKSLSGNVPDVGPPVLP
jgi:cytochrome c peroxidase